MATTPQVGQPTSSRSSSTCTSGTRGLVADLDQSDAVQVDEEPVHGGRVGDHGGSLSVGLVTKENCRVLVCSGNHTSVPADQCQQSLALKHAQRLKERCPADLELIRQLLLTSERVSDGEMLAAADYARPRDRSTFHEAVHELCRELPDLVIPVVGAAPQVGSE